MGKLVLVRHGQSIWNKEKIFTGWVDIGLTLQGKKESRLCGQCLANNKFKFDVAYTSILLRAVETLDIILKQIKQQNIKIVKEIALNERHYGRLQSLSKEKMMRKLGKDQVLKWRRSYDVRPPGGESLEDTSKRAVGYFKEKILKDVKTGKNILVVAHGNSLRAIIMYLEKISKKDIVNLEIPTGVPLVYELCDSRLRSCGNLCGRQIKAAK